MQEPHPDAEYVGRDFPVIVEAAKDETCLRKPGFGPRRRAICNFPLAVVDLIAIRQVDDLLRIEWLVLKRRHRRVGDDVVDELGPHCAGKAEIAYLDRRRTIRKNAGPRILSMSLQINRNIDLEIVEELGGFLVALSADIIKLIKRRDEPPARPALVVLTE